MTHVFGRLTPDPGEAGGAGSEDCLKVNIYTPLGAKKGSSRTLSFGNS